MAPEEGSSEAWGRRTIDGFSNGRRAQTREGVGVKPTSVAADAILNIQNWRFCRPEIIVSTL